MNTLKHSRQRESIKEFLKERHDHPTADVIYQNMRKQYPNISLGTIYRNLTLLESLGEVNKLTYDGGPDHYDSDIRQHYHFVCRECGRVEDLSMELKEDLNEMAGKKLGAQIEGHSLYFHGVCQNCIVRTEKECKPDS